MNALDLYAGGGIGSLGLKYHIPGFRTVCFVENNPYCLALLIARITDGLLEDAPIWNDANTFDGRPWREKVDCIFGGFPCQPFSVAGRREGDADSKGRNMWPATFRIISEVRPRYIFLENVSNILTFEYVRTIFGQMASIGYNPGWDIISASWAGANHLRRRVWILADSGGSRKYESEKERHDEG